MKKSLRHTIETAYKQIINSVGLRQSVFSIAGNSTATFISAASLMLITRILGPEKFGVFSVGFSIVLILTKLNDFGINIAVLLLASTSHTQQYNYSVFYHALRYRLLISSIIAGCGLLSYHYIAQHLGIPEKGIIALACTVGLSTAYYEQFLVFFQSLHKFGSVIVSNITQATLKIIGALLFSLSAHTSVTWLFAAYIAAPCAVIFVAMKNMPEFLSVKNMKYILTMRDSTLENMYKKIVIHSSVAIICAGIIENIDILFVQYYVQGVDAGVYAGMSRLALLFSLVAYYLGDVLNARAAHYTQQEDQKKFLQKAFLIASLAAVAFFALIPFYDLMINLSIGRAFIQGKNYLFLLMAASFFKIAAMPFIALYYSYKKDWAFSVTGLIQLGILLIGNFIFIPIYGAWGAAVMRMVTQASLLFTALFFVIFFYVNKKAH